jgi:hydrogenase expression/formation protein HypD
MRFVTEFRSADLARKAVREIGSLVEPGVPVRIMEVCGGHTHTIYRHGLQQLVPREVELLHGPGCPVCVIPMGRVDDAIWLAEQPGVTLATFGDMLRVPGRRGSLLEAKAAGADVRMVYSPLDALELARREPGRTVVFFAIGFETTAPATAVTLLRARDDGVGNFSAFCNHVTIGPPLRAILDTPGILIDAFVAPGHVSTVIGTRPFDFIARDYGKPVVVTAFEPVDILHAVAMILRQRREGRCEVENQYTRVVQRDGNAHALEAIDETMELRETFEWRGLGFIERSALRIRPEFAAWDAEARFELPATREGDFKACRCGEVLVGAIKPTDCKVFGTACTPERPLGACMVSSEGACAAYYAYGRHLPRERAAAPA